LSTTLSIRRKLTTSPTLSDQAYRVLRKAITDGALAAGERITERSLAQRLGVSPTPIREALRRLEHERLIKRVGGRGIEVVSPSDRERYELTLMEAALRGVAARLAAECATDRELKEIDALLNQIEATYEEAAGEPGRADVLRLTRRFHKLVDEASHNETLIAMIATATAFDWDFRLKVTSKIHTKKASSRERHRQHREIADALLARDGALAEERMRRHISTVSEAFLKASRSE
jgi:DNA-binding GntR family transcriptional regulator